jgi:hypothetical protein
MTRTCCNAEFVTQSICGSASPGAGGGGGMASGGGAAPRGCTRRCEAARCPRTRPSAAPCPGSLSGSMPKLSQAGAGASERSACARARLLARGDSALRCLCFLVTVKKPSASGDPQGPSRPPTATRLTGPHPDPDLWEKMVDNLDARTLIAAGLVTVPSLFAMYSGNKPTPAKTAVYLHQAYILKSIASRSWLVEIKARAGAASTSRRPHTNSAAACGDICARFAAQCTRAQQS